MQNSIGKIAVSMSIRAKEFTSKLTRTRKAVKSNTKSMAKDTKAASASMGRSFAMVQAKMLVLYMGVRKVVRMIRSEFSHIDEARKFAQSIGQAGKNATNQLLAFEYAGARVGATSANVRTALRNMMKSIGEAQMGRGEGVTAMKMIGLDADAIKKLSVMIPTEAFMEISKAMGKLANTSEKVSFAQRLFSKSGVRMLNLVKLTTPEIQKLIDRHNMLAGVMSESSIAAVEATNDAVTDLKTSFNGLQRAIMGAVAPTLFVWFSAAAEQIARLRPMIAAFGRVIAELLDGWLDRTAEVLPGIIKGIRGYGVALYFAYTKAKAFAKTVVSFISQKTGLDGMMPTFENIRDVIYFIGLSLENVGKILPQVQSIFGAFLDALVTKFEIIAVHVKHVLTTMVTDGIGDGIKLALKKMEGTGVGAMLFGGFDAVNNVLSSITGNFDNTSNNAEQQIADQLRANKLARLTEQLEVDMDALQYGATQLGESFVGLWTQAGKEAAKETEKMKGRITTLRAQIKDIMEEAEAAPAAERMSKSIGALGGEGKATGPAFAKFAEMGSQELFASKQEAIQDETLTVQKDQVLLLQDIKLLIGRLQTPEPFLPSGVLTGGA